MMQNLSDKLKMCKNNLNTVLSLLDHTVGDGKSAAIRWTEITIEHLEDVFKELDKQ
jgi:hypothetical protein